jgi:hypothetical protein
MYAVEFETVAKNGFIEIPAHYSEFSAQSVRVVLMMDDKEQQQKIAHMQQLVTQGLNSGVSDATMESIKNRVLNKLSGSA